MLLPRGENSARVAMTSCIGTFFLLSLLTGVSLARKVQNTTRITLNPAFDIIKPTPGQQSSLPVVDEIRSCGGAGQLVEFRYESCIKRGRCTVPGDGAHKRAELEFLPSEDIAELGARFVAIFNNGTDPKTLYDEPIPGRPVKKGETYWTQSKGAPTSELIGQVYTFQYALYRVDTGALEVCAEAEYEVVPP